MKKYAEIIKINQLIIGNKNKKNNKIKIKPWYAIIVLVCMCTITMFSNNMRVSVLRAYNPVSSLYSDESKAVFTSARMNKNWEDFLLPVVTGDVVIDNGNVYMIPTNSIMVYAVEDGIVEDKGTSLDGIKYIKIKHSEDVMSVITNVDIVGVAKGDIVRRGQNIASCKIGERVTLQLYDNDVQITSLSISQSKLVWKK